MNVSTPVEHSQMTPKREFHMYLLYGELRERARYGEFHVLIGYPSEQAGAILPSPDCPFCSRNNISLKSKRVQESFLSQNIFRDSRKIFCDFSVRMELENVKVSNGSGFACGVECVKSKCVRYVCSRRTMTTALKKPLMVCCFVKGCKL